MMASASQFLRSSLSAVRDGGTRTCVSCGGRKEQSDLIRVTAAPDGSPVVDWRGNLGGRGAYVCATTGCLAQAVAGRKLSRSLKREVRYGAVDDLVIQLRTALDRQVETLLRSGSGARRFAAGNDPALEALHRGRAALMLVALDSAGRERYELLAAAAGVPVRTFENKVRLGEMLGRVPTGVVAVLEPSLAKAITRALDRRASFE